MSTAPRSDEATYEPPLPRERSAPRGGSLTAFLVCGCVLLAPLLYVGSFALLCLDDRYGWGLVDWLDPRALDALTVFYWPLIWCVNSVLMAVCV